MHRRFRLPRPTRPARRPRETGLLTLGVRPRALDLPPSGTVRVALRPAWDKLLAGLADVGPVWRITRNRHASLGLREDGGYPRLHVSPRGLLAVDTAGSIAAEFAAWRRAWAVEAKPPCGHRVLAAEFEDGLGEVFHKVCLGGGVSPGRFAAWARAHQADGGADAAAPCRTGLPPVSAAAAPGALHLPGLLLRGLLLSVAEAGLLLRATVHTGGLSQTGTFRAAHASEGGGWLRLQDAGQSAVLFAETEPAGLLRIEPRPVEGETGWRVTLVHPDGRRWLELGSGPDDLSDWNRLVSRRLLRGPQAGPERA